jgi:hypothetical protein
LWSVVTRYREGTPQIVPTRVEAISPVSARFAKVSEKVNLGDGVTEVSTVLEVEIGELKINRPGRSELKVLFSDGSTMQQELLWEIISPLRAYPSGFVLRQQEGRVSKTVLVQSDEEPFQVKGVDNPLSHRESAPEVIDGSPSPNRASTRVVSLDFDPSVVGPDTTSTIRILTDHPEQPEIRVNVLVLGTDRGEQP